MDKSGSTYRLAELVIRGEAEEAWPFLTFDMAAPVLRAALRSGDSALVRDVTRLINELGERGYEDFRRLLSESE